MLQQEDKRCTATAIVRTPGITIAWVDVIAQCVLNGGHTERHQIIGNGWTAYFDDENKKPFLLPMY